MPDLKQCPVCGAKATVIRMYDTYDRADFGYTAGCTRYKANDGIHTAAMKVNSMSKEAAIEAWNRRAGEEEA